MRTQRLFKTKRRARVMSSRPAVQASRLPIETKRGSMGPFQNERPSPEPGVEATLQSNDVAVACLQPPKGPPLRHLSSNYVTPQAIKPHNTHREPTCITQPDSTRLDRAYFRLHNTLIWSRHIWESSVACLDYVISSRVTAACKLLDGSIASSTH